MILQALEQCYGIMEQDDKFEVPKLGYSLQNCSFAIEIDVEGNLKSERPLDLRDGKRGQQHIVPMQKGRSGKTPPPYFLCENCKYFFGATYNKKADALEDCSSNLAAAYQLHEKILATSEDNGAKAILSFLKKRLNKEPLPFEKTHDLYTSGFMLVKLAGNDGYIHERSAIKKCWESYYAAQEMDGEIILGQCLITGKENTPIARIHTLTKGVLGGKASGGSLVGFNFDSVQSYRKSQSYNAPVSAAAMFHYTTALNMLLARSENRLIMGDMTCVFWTENEVVGNTVDAMMNGMNGLVEEAEVELEQRLQLDDLDTKKTKAILLRILYGREITEEMIKRDADATVYILGLAPNAARLSVRIWYKNTFGNFADCITQHFMDMEISKSARDKRVVPIRDLLYAMAVGGKSENVPKTMENALFTAVTTGGLYPQGVYTNILIRIRAEVGDGFAINRIRVGFIKAYLKRKYRMEKAREKEEEITVALNENLPSNAYQLGRLFAILEKLQQDAGNKGLRERYFASASTNPKVVFSTILRLAQSHIAKIGKSISGPVYWDLVCAEILGKVNAIVGSEEGKFEAFPASLNAEEQGLFILGYYHQRQAIYTKKEEKQ